MADNNGLWFWQRYSALYDLFMRKDRRAYDTLGIKICAELDSRMDALELAVGTGLVAQRVAGCCRSYLATDYSEKMLGRAERKKWPDTVRFEQADATALPYPDESFDIVIISNALHIMPDPIAALSNIRRVLRKGGKLIAPTFVRYGTKKDSVLEKPMQWLGFRSWSSWSPVEYETFLHENGWHILHSEIIPAGFDIAFVVARS